MCLDICVMCLDVCVMCLALLLLLNLFVVDGVASEEVVAGTQITGGVGRGKLYLAIHCHH